MATVNEALVMEPENKVALYRRARARALPVNSGVPDFRLAVKDLKAILSDEPRIVNEIKRLQRLIEVNS